MLSINNTHDPIQSHKTVPLSGFRILKANLLVCYGTVLIGNQNKRSYYSIIKTGLGRRWVGATFLTRLASLRPPFLSTSRRPSSTRPFPISIPSSVYSVTKLSPVTLHTQGHLVSSSTPHQQVYQTRSRYRSLFILCVFSKRLMYHVPLYPRIYDMSEL